jgi:hypothetical protein
VNLHRGMDKLRRSLGLAGAEPSREDST